MLNRILCLIIAAVLAAGVMPAAAASFAISPSADANIQGGSGANTNFGSSENLAIRTDGYRSAYLKFDLSRIRADAVSVRFYISGAVVSDADKLKIEYIADDSWSEDTITANNAPGGGAFIASGVYEGNKSYSFDVTETVKNEADGILSLRLYYDDVTAVNYAFKSKEAASDRPMLVFETSQRLKVSQRGNLVKNGDFSAGLSDFDWEFISGSGEVSADGGKAVISADSDSAAVRISCSKIRAAEYEVYQCSAVCTGNAVMNVVYYGSDDTAIQSRQATVKSTSGSSLRMYDESVAPEDTAFMQIMFTFTGGEGTLENTVAERKEKYNILEPCDRTIAGSGGLYNVMYGERYTLSASAGSDTAEIHASYYSLTGEFIKNYIFSMHSGGNLIYLEVPYEAVFMSIGTNGETVENVFLCKNCCNMIEDGGIEQKETFSKIKNIIAYTEDSNSGAYAARLYANAQAELKPVITKEGSYRLSLYAKGSGTAVFIDAAGRTIPAGSFSSSQWQYYEFEAELPGGEISISVSTVSGCFIDDLCMERLCARPRVLFGEEDMDFSFWNSEPYYSCYLNSINRNGTVNNKDVNSIILRYLKDGETKYMSTAAGLIVSTLAGFVDQIPSYTSERMGRRMQTYSYYYDIMDYSGYFTKYQKACARNSLIRLADMQMSSEYGDFGNNNRNVDRYAGVAFVGLALPEFSLSEILIEHAKEYAISDLEGGVISATDGTWPETTRYVDVVIKTLTCLSRALTRYDGTDLFRLDGFKSMVKGFMEICTPTDGINAGGHVTAPAIGDASWGEVSYSTFFWVAPEYKDSDPELSEQLMYIWKMGGQQMSDGNIQYGLLFGDTALPASEPELKSVLQSDIGYAVFRNNKSLDKQDYFIMHAPERNFYHRHSDAGGFSIYAFGTPVMLDAGVGAYDEATIGGYNRTSCHNAVSFVKDGVIQNGPSVASKITEFTSSCAADKVSVTINDPAAEKYVRRVLYLKGSMNSYIVYDSIVSDNTSLNNLHMLTEGAEIDKNRISGVTSGGVGLDVDILLPDEAYIEKQEDSVYSNKNSYTNTQEYFTVSGNAGETHLTLINPYLDSGFSVSCEYASDGVYKYKAVCKDEFYYIILNDTDCEIDIGGDDLYNAHTGAAAETLAPKDIAVLVNRAYICRLADVGYTLDTDGKNAAAELFNNTRSQLGGVIIAAQYDGGQLLSAQSEDFDIAAGNSRRFDFAFDAFSQRIRIFLLENYETMKPIICMGE